MSFRRALVDCAVLSLQDTCVFYPCCRACFSRIDAEQQDTARCRCVKCGYRCLREQVDYRYRLSLRVARDRCIFGITVFGNSLNPFFGIHANGLQRLVENLDRAVEPSTRFRLLVKAVEDCFIGRHFIFGIKVLEAQSGPWFGGPVPNGSISKNAVQFVATQMILPKATAVGGCTVVSYYRILLQKACESDLGSADTSKASRLPATIPLLIHSHSPASSFSSTPLSACGLLSRSLQRSQHKDCTLTPTPPWQQSLGLVTSSAEQEEGCSTQESGDENSSQTDKSTTPHPAQRGCLENHKTTEDLDSLHLSEHSFCGSPSLEKYPNSSNEKGAGNNPSLNSWSSPSQSGQKRCSHKAKEFSTGQFTRTFLSSSLAWDDLPFSESLAEFLCEENKDFDIDSDTKQIQNLYRNEEKAQNHLGDTCLPNETTSSCHRNAQITGIQMLLDITNTPAENGGGRCDLSSQECKNPIQCVNKSRDRNIYSHNCNQEDKEASSQCFQKEEEEQLEGDTYNCSADLFSSSVMITVDTERLSTHTEDVRTGTEACPQLSKPDQQHLSYQNANVTWSTPDKQKLKRSKCRESLISQDTKDFDFVPPSQSTPIVKVGVVSQSPAFLNKNLTGEFSSQPDNQDFGVFYGSLHEMDSKNNPVHKLHQALQGGSESVKENQVWSTKSSWRSHRLTPKRMFWKPAKHKNHRHAQQHLRVRGGALNLMSTGTVNWKYDSRVSDVTESYCEDNEVVVPPTSAGKMQLSMPLRRRKLTDNSNNLGSTGEMHQREKINCNTTLLEQTLTSSNSGLAQTEICDSETVSEGILDHENQTCDWSRDLFSESF